MAFFVILSSLLDILWSDSDNFWMYALHQNHVICYLGHGDELGVLLVLLTDVGKAAEDEHAHDDHQHQQTQLLVAEQQGC